MLRVLILHTVWKRVGATITDEDHQKRRFVPVEMGNNTLLLRFCFFTYDLCLVWCVINRTYGVIVIFVMEKLKIVMSSGESLY